MAKVYIKLFYDFIEMTEPLTHEERGRLVLAMLEYAQNKQVPDDALTGNERVLFPLFRRMVDWELDSYAKLCDQNSRNGKKGGRPKKPGITHKNRNKKKNRGEGAPKRPTPQPWTRFWIIVGRTGCL